MTDRSRYSLAAAVIACALLLGAPGCAPAAPDPGSGTQLQTSRSDASQVSGPQTSQQPGAELVHTPPEELSEAQRLELFTALTAASQRLELVGTQTGATVDGAPLLTVAVRSFGQNDMGVEQQLTDELFKARWTGNGYEVELHYRRVYPLQVPLDEAVLQLQPRALDPLGPEEERFLQFVYNYDICGGPCFTDASRLSDAQRYHFFCMMQDMDCRWKGQEGALEQSLYDEEAGRIDLPVSVVRDYLQSYLGDGRFDPQIADAAMNGRLYYDAQEDMLHPLMLSGFGGGGRNFGLLSFEQSGPHIQMVVGSYDTDDIQQQELRGYYTLHLRPGEQGAVSFVLESVTYTQLYPKQGAQAVIELSQDPYVAGYDTFQLLAWQAAG